MKKLPEQAVFVKLGGSVITDKTKPMKLRPDAIKQLAGELTRAYDLYPDVRWFVGNGAGSFGHYMVHKTGWSGKPDVPLSTAQVRAATSRLNVEIIDALTAAGLPALSMPPASWLRANKATYTVKSDLPISWTATGYVPVVYGDLIKSDRGTTLVPTEVLLDILAEEWISRGNSIRQVIYCTGVDGVLDSTGNKLATLSKGELGEHIGAASGYDVSGGMFQKVQAGFRALRYCDDVRIINGFRANELLDALSNKAVGTRLR